MKRFTLAIGFMAGLLLPLLIGWKDSRQENAKVSAVLAIRKIKLKPGTTEAAMDQFASRVAQGEFGKLPGVRIEFAKGERGDEPGSYVLLMHFDSKATRDFYAPDEAIQGKRSDQVTKMIDDYFKAYNAEFDKLAEQVKPPGKEGYVDYLILE